MLDGRYVVLCLEQKELVFVLPLAKYFHFLIYKNQVLLVIENPFVENIKKKVGLTLHKLM